MNGFKKIISLMLVFLLVLSFAGCHSKGEVAVKFGDVEFTSGVYSMALLNAYSEGISLVEEQKAKEQEEKKDENSQNVQPEAPTDYLSQKIEGEDFKDWVEKKAIEELSKMAAYKIKAKENKIELSKEELADIDSYVNYYYPQNEKMFVANGIGKESLKETRICYAYANEYFKFLYGENGPKAVDEASLKAVYDKSYATAMVLYSDLSKFDTDEKKADEKKRLDEFKKRLDKGENEVAIYNECNGLTGENAVKEIKDLVSVLADGEVDANYGFEDFKTVKELKYGQTAVIDESKHDHHHDHINYYVIKSIDTSGMEDFYKGVKQNILWNLKHEEYEKEMADFAASLKPEKNKHAIKPFKVEKITLQ